MLAGNHRGKGLCLVCSIWNLVNFSNFLNFLRSFLFFLKSRWKQEFPHTYIIIEICNILNAIKTDLDLLIITIHICQVWWDARYSELILHVHICTTNAPYVNTASAFFYYLFVIHFLCFACAASSTCCFVLWCCNCSTHLAVPIKIFFYLICHRLKSGVRPPPFSYGEHQRGTSRKNINRANGDWGTSGKAVLNLFIVRRCKIERVREENWNFPAWD